MYEIQYQGDKTGRSQGRLWPMVSMIMLCFLVFQAAAQPSRPVYNFLEGKIDSCINPAKPLDPLFIPVYEVQHKPAKAVIRPARPFRPASLDPVFYFLCGLLLFIGITIRSFPKYYSDLYRVFVRSGFRQKSIRDQLVQNKAASLGLNAIFFISGGFFIYLVSQNNTRVPVGSWYLQIILCIGFLLSVYLVKYLSLKAGGWIFSARELVDNYAFLVFFVNKIAGLLLVPVIVVLCLGSPSLHPFFLVCSLLFIGILFLYRFILILPLVRNKSGISSFHFFLYLCTFEILPIMLLVKFLVNFLNTSN